MNQERKCKEQKFLYIEEQRSFHSWEDFREWEEKEIEKGMYICPLSNGEGCVWSCSLIPQDKA